MTDDLLVSPALDAVLLAAAHVLGMEAALLGLVGPDGVLVERVRTARSWSGLQPGLVVGLDDPLWARALDGQAATTSDVDGSGAARELGVRSYAAVPVRDAAGRVAAVLCAADRDEVAVDGAALSALGELGDVAGPVLAPAGVTLRRVASGWHVLSGGPERGPAPPRVPGPGTAPDLTSAMALADLLAEDLGRTRAPLRSEVGLDEVGQLRLSVSQLEYALSARVGVEQALGVLVERQYGSPREAFERLRQVSRSQSRRVHDLARQVVRSAQDRTVSLPPELSPRT